MTLVVRVLLWEVCPDCCATFGRELALSVCHVWIVCYQNSHLVLVIFWFFGSGLLGFRGSAGDQAGGVRCALRVPRASRPSAFTYVPSAPRPPDRVMLMGGYDVAEGNEELMG